MNFPVTDALIRAVKERNALWRYLSKNSPEGYDLDIQELADAYAKAEVAALTTECDALRAALLNVQHELGMRCPALEREAKANEIIDQALAGQPEVRKEASKLDRGGASGNEERDMVQYTGNEDRC